MHKLKIGQIFRYPIDKVRDKSEIEGYPNFSFYTDLPNQKLVKLDSGINPIGKVVNKIIDRTPAILTRSSLHKTGSLITPWEDFYNIDKGHIRFFGDNKVRDNKVIEDPEKKKGNKALIKQFELLHYAGNSSHPTYPFFLDRNYSFQVILFFVSENLFLFQLRFYRQYISFVFLR